MGSGQVYYHPGKIAEAAPAGGSPVLDTQLWRACAIDITLNSLTGGVTPAITFAFSRVGHDGIQYPVWTSGAISATGVISVSLSDSMSAAYAAGTLNEQGVVFSDKGIFTWAFGGGTPPTGVDFSATVYGRQ